MSSFDDLKFKFDRFSIAEKLITINIFFFIVPFFLQTIFWLFKIPTIDFSSLLHLLPNFIEY